MMKFKNKLRIYLYRSLLISESENMNKNVLFGGNIWDTRGLHDQTVPESLSSLHPFGRFLIHFSITL